MKSKVYHHPVQIYYEDTDHSGVVYHPNFLKYFERAREHTIGSQTLLDLWENDGLGFAVYKVEMTCKDGVKFSEIVDIRSQVEMDGEFRSIWHQELWRPKATGPAVVSRIEMVCMNKDKMLKPFI